jgi:tRNA(adenine34) deaminase
MAAASELVDLQIFLTKALHRGLEGAVEGIPHPLQEGRIRLDRFDGVFPSDFQRDAVLGFKLLLKTGGIVVKPDKVKPLDGGFALCDPVIQVGRPRIGEATEVNPVRSCHPDADLFLFEDAGSLICGINRTVEVILDRGSRLGKDEVGDMGAQALARFTQKGHEIRRVRMLARNQRAVREMTTDDGPGLLHVEKQEGLLKLQMEALKFKLVLAFAHPAGGDVGGDGIHDQRPGRAERFAHAAENAVPRALWDMNMLNPTLHGVPLLLLSSFSSSSSLLKMKSTPPPPCPFEKLRPSELVRDAAYFMAQAYNEALRAWEANEVPIGAVIEFGGSVVARAHNQVESLNDPTAHAEILAITQASQAVGDWRLNGATLYVTKEPCPMCSGAAVMARLEHLVYAVPDPKMGCLGGATAVHELPRLNHRLQVHAGVLQTECTALIQEYFQRKRSAG